MYNIITYREREWVRQGRQKQRQKEREENNNKMLKIGKSGEIGKLWESIVLYMQFFCRLGIFFKIKSFF